MFKDLKPTDFILTLARSLFRYEEIQIFFIDLSKIDSRAIKHQPNSEIIKGDIKDLDQYKQNLTVIPWEMRCHLIDNVKDFIIYQDEGIIQHISWVYYKDNPNRLIRLYEDDAEIKYCLTFEEYRGRGIYPQVLKYIVDDLCRKGFKRVFICVRSDNMQSIRGIQKAGFKYLDTICLKKMFGVQVSKRYSFKEF